MLNPLATPKGVKLVCELCQKPAYVQCTKCRVTYYCGEEHQRDDWLSIHEQICSIVSILRSPQPHAISEEERAHRRHQQTLRKKHIIDLSLREGRRFLYKGQPSLALPAATEALRFMTEVYGEANIELTPAYLILAEAAVGMGRLKEADQYLSQAQWSVLKTPDCDPGLKSRLHRNLGQLAAAKNQLPEARRHFAEDIYQSSVAYSPDAIQTSGGYFHLGRVFLMEGKMDIADSLHSRVVSIWHSHLGSLVEQMVASHRKEAEQGAELSPRPSFPSKSAGGGGHSHQLDVAEKAEGSLMLHSINELREHQPPSQGGGANVTMATTPIYHTLALLHTVVGEHDKAIAYAEEAVKLLSRSEQPQVSGGRGRRSSHSDGGEGSGSSAATVTEDPAELVNIINTLAKKTQQLQD